VSFYLIVNGSVEVQVTGVGYLWALRR